jgi:hypothetical protein
MKATWGVAKEADKQGQRTAFCSGAPLARSGIRGGFLANKKMVLISHFCQVVS